MNKKQAIFYACFQGLSKPLDAQPCYVPQPHEEQNTTFSEICKVIYTPDEYGHIKSDIYQYLDSKTSPEIRQFIQEYLMKPVKPVSSSYAGKMDDDTILELMPADGETSDAYASRLRNYIQDTTESIQRAKEVTSPDTADVSNS